MTNMHSLYISQNTLTCPNVAFGEGYRGKQKSVRSDIVSSVSAVLAYTKKVMIEGVIRDRVYLDYALEEKP